MVLERWTKPKLSRRTRTCGIAKLFHRCTSPVARPVHPARVSIQTLTFFACHIAPQPLVMGERGCDESRFQLATMQSMVAECLVDKAYSSTYVTNDGSENRDLVIASTMAHDALASLRDLAHTGAREASDTKSSLGDAKSSLGDAKSSLGDAKSSLGDG
jgi:hypothetical protein